jgi:hypothetical protein
METDQNTPPPGQPLNLLWFSLLAILVRVVVGIGGVLFRGLIALIHILRPVHGESAGRSSKSPTASETIGVITKARLGEAVIESSELPEN